MVVYFVYNRWCSTINKTRVHAVFTSLVLAYNAENCGLMKRWQKHLIRIQRSGKVLSYAMLVGSENNARYIRE